MSEKQKKQVKWSIVSLLFIFIAVSAYQIVITLLYPDAKTSKNILKQFNSDIEDHDGHFTYNKEDDVYIFEFSESFAYSVKEEQTYRKGEIRYTTGEDESGTGYISSFLTKVAHLGREAHEETNKEITIKVVSPLKKSEYMLMSVNGTEVYRRF